MLDYQDVNIVSQSKVGCHFEKNFVHKENYNTFNNNDKQGRGLLFLIILVISLLITYFVTKNKLYLSLSFLFFILSILYVYKKPIRILYSGSYIISSQVKTPEYLNRQEYFPNCIYFENPKNFQLILKECLEIYKKKKVLPLTKNTFSKENEHIGGAQIQSNEEDGWRLYLVQAGNNYPAANTMPFLVSILKQLDEVKSCAVSILPAKKIIPIHVGYYKGVMRYQLAIKVPSSGECFICVNGKKYTWTVGQGVLFDDTYAHKVYNDSNEDRIVLYMDIERPNLGSLKWMNKSFLYLANNSSIAKKEVASTEKLESLLKND